MSNYCCTVRTNYFHVKDEHAFFKLMNRTYGCEDVVEVFWREEPDGEITYGFGAYGGIGGVINPEHEDCAYDEFIFELQKCIPKDDAVIIMESGNEKLRYVVGNATVITSKEIVYLDIAQLAVEKACKLLRNSCWDTRCEY